MKKFVNEVAIITEDNAEFSVTYFICEIDNIFGVAAELSQNGTVIDSENVHNLWENRADAINCINILAANTVTPTSLVEILDDHFIQ